MTPAPAAPAASATLPRLSGVGVPRLREGRHRIVLTGAGGWLGLATLELLHATLGGAAFEARVRCFGSVARTLRLRCGIAVPQEPLAALDALDPAPTLLLHHAFLTKDKAEVMEDAAYIAANLAIRRTVLERLDGLGVEAVFVPSSGAARFADDPHVAPAMRLYGRLKRDDEEAFAAWAETEGKTAVIARVFNLAGPYINKHDAYALAGFILAAQAERPIEVRAPHPVLRSYVAIRELMSIVFGTLTDPAVGVVRFDTAGEATLEMAEVAQAVADVLGPVPVQRAALSETHADRYVGERTGYVGLRKAMTVETVSFTEQILETAGYLADPAA